MRDDKKDKVEQPFFVQFLEDQKLDDANGGAAGRTDKYPSDYDEMTLKYPSDDDEPKSPWNP